MANGLGMGDYLDPENISGYLRDRVAPAWQEGTWLQELYDLGYDIQNMSVTERLQAAADVGIQTSVGMANTIGSGLAGIGTLVKSGGDFDAAADTVNSAVQNSPFQWDLQSEPGQVLSDTLGKLSDPVEFGIKQAGKGMLAASDSPAAATATEVALGALIPGKGKGPGKHKNKRVKNREGEMVKRPTQMTDVPDIRDLDVKEALEIAKYEPHLLESGAGGEGKYIGGPRNIKTRQALTKQRGILDDTIARGAEGGDWYDRYRGAVTDVTGGNLKDDLWMTNLEGQYSAGVSPEGELAFAIKDTNAAIANKLPGKPARPAQRDASIRAIQNNDPSEFMLGPKTGEYARRVNPAASNETTATGVNDFRHARNLGYTEKSGAPQREGLGATPHRFMDYETALAVDRANEGRLAGRDDWTGEQVQAAPWVAQKGDDLYDKRIKHYTKEAQLLIDRQGLNEPVDQIAKRLAFDDANRTIGDFYDKHTAFATYEAQPFVDAGHLPRLADATPKQRAAFANDPKSAWDFAPGGRDAIYSGTRLDDTGYAVRTRPTTEMQGAYTPPDGEVEYNPGKVARPLVAFDVKDGGKTVPDADQSILNAGEAIRAAIDVQGAGAWHKPWTGGKVKDSDDITISRGEGPSDPSELTAVQEVAQKYGFEDIIDTGQGFTLTTFYPGKPPKLKNKEINALTEELSKVTGGETRRAKLDSGYLGYEDQWKDGGVTKLLMERMDELPAGTREAMDNNPNIPKAAMMRLERDEKFSKKYGATREDVQNLRRIIGEGPGWMDRLTQALKSGAVLPALAAVVLASSLSDDDHIGLLSEFD